MNDINSYGDLKRAVQLWLNRKDDATLKNIPMFINMAMKQFARMVKLPYYEVLATFEVPEGVNYVGIPQDFLSAKHLSVNSIPYNRVDNETFLRLRGKGKAPTPYNIQTGIQGATLETQYFFTRVGGQLQFIPELTTGDLVELIYQRDIPELTGDSTDDFYPLLVASDVILYLSLRHASTFLRDPEQDQYWMGKATEAAQSLQDQLNEAEWSGSAIVVPMFTR